MARATVKVTPKELPEQALQRVADALGTGLPVAKARDRSVFEDIRDLKIAVQTLNDQFTNIQQQLMALDGRHISCHERIDALHPDAPAAAPFFRQQHEDTWNEYAALVAEVNAAAERLEAAAPEPEEPAKTAPKKKGSSRAG